MNKMLLATYREGIPGGAKERLFDRIDRIDKIAARARVAPLGRNLHNIAFPGVASETKRPLPVNPVNPVKKLFPSFPNPPARVILHVRQMGGV